jgi:hypothetical protein
MKRPLLLSVLLLALIAPELSFALPSIGPKIRDKEIRVGFLANGYLTKTRESLSDERTGNIGLNLGLRGVGNKDAFQFGIEVDSLYGLRKANYRYLDISEAYLGYDTFHWFTYAGRKRFDWSEMDSYWSLGLFQPRFRWDYLNERENALFGWFVGAQNENFHFVAYASPIYIPEQGAPFDIDGGDCKTASPWFACPTATIALFNQSTDVNYSLDIPPVKDLITNYGYGATLRIGKSLGVFGRASYVHKPMNQFLLSYEGTLNLSSLSIPAIIRPRVLYHDLFGFDFGHHWVRHAIVGSMLWEKPKRDNPPTTWNTQEAYDARLLSITAKTMPLPGRFSRTRLEASFFHRSGGNGPDRGPFAQRQAVFEPRYAFKNAYSFAVLTPIFDSWSSSFLLGTKFVWDTANQGNILQSDLYFWPLARTTVNLGIDILGSESTSTVDFISRYQRNDRVRGGITYVF